MAQTFAINGTTLDYITGADWETSAVTEDMLGQTRQNRFRRHVWRADVVLMDEWQTLSALEGQLVNFTTTNPQDINADYITFYGVNLNSVSAQEHSALNMLGVSCEFLVKV